MTYKEALYFTAKCLTLGHYPGKIAEVRGLIHSGIIDWELVVWASTGQFVFPALHLQLKRAGLLSELPPDLVEYMEEITGLNRERNKQIIDQAAEVATLLNQHGFTPIFLKGTANLLAGLYEDIGERMVGDIDFLVEEKDMVPVAELLIDTGYEPIDRYNPWDFKITKHYPRLVNVNRTANVEVHRQVLQIPYDKSLPNELIVRDKLALNLPFTACVMSHEHQIIHNILNVQINDFGYYYAGIFLRQSYDLFLLSRRENPLVVTQNYGKFFHRVNGYLAVSHELFDHPDCIPWQADFSAKSFLNRIKRNLDNPRWERLSHALLYLILRFSNYARVLVRITHNKDARRLLFKRLRDPKWYNAHIKSYKELF